MAKRQESWRKKAAEEAESFLSGARGAERVFTRVKSEKQGPKDTESRGGMDVVQYQSLHNQQQQQWRGDPSPRDRTELATGPMNESPLMKSESGGVMMMAQPQQQQQQQTRASFWQAFARTTSENQLGLLQSRAQAVVCTDLRGNITSW